MKNILLDARRLPNWKIGENNVTLIKNLVKEKYRSEFIPYFNQEISLKQLSNNLNLMRRVNINPQQVPSSKSSIKKNQHRFKMR